MLNRRLLRVKVFQALYGYFQSEDADIVKGEKALFLSIDRVYQLYLHFLMLPLEIAHIAQLQMEEAKGKVLPSKEDIEPNLKFIDGYVLKALEGNHLLKKKANDQQVSWVQHQELLQRIWRKVKTSDFYSQYINNEGADHRKFIIQLYQRYILDNEDLYTQFQEQSIYWDFEDCDFAINMAIRYFDKIKSEELYKQLPAQYKDNEDDVLFVRDLYRKTIANDADNTRFIEEKTKNWEVERIALLDVILMKMAITEFLQFPSIPVKVTLNEYIELAKQFSSPKSKLFINGVLDKLLIEFKNNNQLKKSGRGLIQ
ncbi:MAG: transcription antitermination factor NusB [Verrucomicrobia bacterium]|nr:transcription antitermination factor NusB [Verrucomicrobiota bacterium]